MSAFWGAYLATLTTVQVVLLALIAAKYGKKLVEKMPELEPPE